MTIVDRLAEALIGNDGDPDMCAVAEVLKSALPAEKFQALCDALELCPFHCCDYRICADDGDPECDGGKRTLTVEWKNTHAPDCPVTANRANLARDLEADRQNPYLLGAVPEHDEGGDEEAEHCTCKPYGWHAGLRP